VKHDVETPIAKPAETAAQRRPAEEGGAAPQLAPAAQKILRLQRSHGNRHVQRMVALARQATGAPGGGELDPEVESSIQRARGGGHGLDGSVRAQMETSLGADLSGVRVHTGSEADRLNQAVSARAFTTGSDVFFRQGEYSPGSSTGRELLAHELTHVVQQDGAPVQAKLTLGPVDDPAEREADEVARNVMQRAEAPVPGPVARSEELQRRPAPGKAAQSDWKKFYVTIPAGAGTQLQFLRYAEVQIFGRVIDLQWDTSKEATVHEPSKHVGKTILFKVRPVVLEKWGVAQPTAAEKAATDAEYKGLDPDEKDTINAETDRRYYESTQEEPGTKIKSGEKGKAVVWNSLRDEVLGDRRRLAQLPETVRALVGADNLTLEHAAILSQVGDVLSQLSEAELKGFFVIGPNGSTISPNDYSRLLILARKLVALSPEARKDYLERVSASTMSLVDLERAINRYVRMREEREKQAEGHEAAAKPLLGAEDVYTAYRHYKAVEAYVEFVGDDDRTVDLLDKLWQAEETLEAGLKLKGFNSIADFEAALRSYRIAFRTQAVNLALDVLDRYDHMLFEERNRLEQGAATGIAQGIAATQALAHYKEYRRQKQIAENILMMRDEYDDISSMEPYIEADSAAEEAKKKGEAEVIRGAGDHPLVAERGIDREKLAGLDAAGVHSYLMAQISERRNKVAIARREFEEDPDRVFNLPDLVAATQKLMGIEPTTIYGRTIHDYISDEAGKHFLSQVAIGILALALTVLVPGGGWLAAAALVAQAGISTYQAYTAYKEYQEQERDYELGFLSEEPSLFWVGLAIAGAALDIGVATSALVKQSATALKALKGPLLEFSKDSNLAKLVEQIEAVQGLETKLKTALAREAEASLAAKAAFKEALSIASRPNMIAGAVDPGLIKQLFRGLYYSIKRGVNTFAKLSAEAKLLEITGDITRLSGAERAELEAAFEEVKQIVQAGTARGMDDKSLLGFVDRWALNRGRPGFQVKLAEEIKAWKPLAQEQQRALSALEAQKSAVATLYERKAAALEELDELRAELGAQPPKSRNPKDVEEVRKLEKEILSYDPEALPTRTQPPGKGKIFEAEKRLADLEAEAAKSQLTLYDRLRAAAPSEAAKERALRGVTIDQVGPLKTRPTPLHADHIVSVREISDLDGFADLPWKDQKAIVDLKENLIAMDGAANASKGDRTWRSWGQAGNFYERSTIETMAKREADVRALIEAEIKDRLAKLRSPGQP